MIDPLLASTYLGGNIADNGSEIVLDSNGNVFVVGFVYSTGYYPIISGAYKENNSGSYDIVISKLSNDLTTLMASTYIGGSDYDTVKSISVDSSDNIYVIGDSDSYDYPFTTGVYQTSNSGFSDIVVSKLSNDLASLLASTYIGGSDEDDAGSMILDDSNNVYIAGYSDSNDYPFTDGAYQTSNSGLADIVVSKLSNDLTTLMASTYVGGSDSDFVDSMTLDNNGNVFIIGDSESGYPITTGVYQPSASGLCDIVISKLSSDLSELLASTYIGGGDDEFGYSINTDSNDNVYIAGFSFSSDYPFTDGAYQTINSGLTDVIVSKLSNDLTSLMASTYIGGIGYDIGRSIKLNSAGDVYIVGDSYSGIYPATAGAYQGYNAGSGDVIISKLNSDLTSLASSTYIGGSSYEEGYSIALDNSDNVYILGESDSINYPKTPGVYQEFFAGGNSDMVISKMSLPVVTLNPEIHLGPSSIDFGDIVTGQSSEFQQLIIGNVGDADLTISEIALENSVDFTLDLNSGTSPCGNTYPKTLSPMYYCTVTVAFNPTAEGAQSTNLIVTSNSPGEETVNIALSGSGIVSSIIADDYEEDDSSSNANIITVNDPLNQQHNFHDHGDEDWVRFYAVSGEAYAISTQNLGSGADTVIELYDQDATTLIVSRDYYGLGQDETLGWTPSQNGIYYIKIRNYDPSNFGNDASYDLLMYRSYLCDFYEIVGSVTDSDTSLGVDGAILVGSEGSSAISEADGAYTMFACNTPVNVTANADGYQEASENNVDLSISQATTVNFSLVLDSTPVADISVNPTSIDFGDVTVNQTSPEQEITISNDGNADLTILSQPISGDNSHFLINPDGGSSPCGQNYPKTINSGDSCTLMISFLPNVAINYSTDLVISSNDPDEGSSNVSLTGNGIAVPTYPDISVNPTSIDFGGIPVNQSSTEQEITISNSGDADLVISGIDLPDSTPFSLNLNGGSSPCGQADPTINPTNSCTVTVTFNPTEDGSQSTNLTIGSNDPDSGTVNVSLNGIGAVPVYRFGNYQNGLRFWTTDNTEAQMVRDDLDWLWKDEGIAYHVFKDSEPGTVPVYRFGNYQNGLRFWTTDNTEAQMVKDDLGWLWKDEGIAFYVYPDDTTPNTTPVYRFGNYQNGLRFWTTDNTEAQMVRDDLDWLWKDEGEAYWVL